MAQLRQVGRKKGGNERFRQIGILGQISLACVRNLLKRQTIRITGCRGRRVRTFPVINRPRYFVPSLDISNRQLILFAIGKPTGRTPLYFWRSMLFNRHRLGKVCRGNFAEEGLLPFGIMLGISSHRSPSTRSILMLSEVSHSIIQKEKWLKRKR